MKERVMENLREVMVSTGRISGSDKLKLESVEPGARYSDNVKLIVSVTKKRCRKPFMVWVIPFNEVKGVVNLEEAHFEKL